ncbi:relaxase/mobilization nuclease domain-containing protein [Rhodopseudomonas palustris]|uniref:relaxase/mobilization nuclease domain-containing protein n=1 Tax=Rhodopseudomonas palustris TaxID=1076 RepID=UPI0021F368E4|nr:LPD7 domain-containing protein [Rhodopseudomonas palustris]
MLKQQDGQVVEVMPARGLAAEHLRDQIRELVASSAHGRTDRPIHHVHIDPPPDAANPEEIIETFVEHYEREFGLGNAQRCGVYHTKSGRKHGHIIWSLVRDNGSVISLAHDRPRREKISRIVEFEHGLPMTKGKHNRSAVEALRAEGRVDVADAMEAAGLLDGKRPVAHSTPQQRAQAERTAVRLDEIRTQALAAWQASDDSRSFAIALHAFDFSVATGDRGLVLIDRTGNTHSLNRVLAAAARAEGVEKITAAMVRKRIAGIRFPTVEDVKNAQRNRGNSESSDRRARELGAPAPAPESSRRAGERNEPARRVDGPAAGDRSNPWSSHRNAATPRKRIRDRAAAIALSGMDLQGVIHAKGEIMKSIKAQNFKAKILAEIAPEGFDAHPFASDLRMIKKPAPGNSAARILMTDGGWLEYDSVRRSVRTWGPTGHAQVLAAALADKLGCEVEHLAKTASVGADAEALKVAKISEDTIKSLVMWWSARGYSATGGPDGCWVTAGRARILDVGDKMEIHGGLTDEAINATIVKARDAWGSVVYLDGDWTQAEQDRLWIAAQRAGIEVRNCQPSQSMQSAWQREQAATAKMAKTISSARSAIAVATDVRDAATGDIEAAERLPPPLQTFVGLYLDDEQRKHLSGQSIADITAALPRFRTLGEAELAEHERAGTVSVPLTPRRDDRDHDRDAGSTYSR